jgi:transcriptional regulator with XRE-family HTH domain
MATNEDDQAMARVRIIWAAKQEAGWTMQRLGEAMGYSPAIARKSVHQFLKSSDPRMSMLRRFAKAVGVKISTLAKE